MNRFLIHKRIHCDHAWDLLVVTLTCGKLCRTCDDGPHHGPYLYAQHRKKRTLRYIGLPGSKQFERLPPAARRQAQSFMLRSLRSPNRFPDDPPPQPIDSPDFADDDPLNNNENSL